MNSIPYTLTERAVTFFFDGKQRTIDSSHQAFTNIVDSILKGDTEVLSRIVNVKKFISKITEGRVMITTNDEVVFDNEYVPDYLASRIISHYNRDPRLITPLMKFAENLMQNPSSDVREDLYLWLEKGNMPITSDGYFLAYKLVREDFSPIHQGLYGHDQSPGTLVSMPRNECNPYRNATCAEGLHFCSYEYLPIFQEWNRNAGRKVILLKINPKDVVAIPTDYNLTKGRCCEFFVLEEINPKKIKEDFADLLVWEVPSYEYNEPTEYDGFDEEDEGYSSDKEWALQVIKECNGNKTAAAQRMGVARSTLYRMINS